MTAMSHPVAFFYFLLVFVTPMLYSESAAASESAAGGLVLIANGENQQSDIYLRTLRGIYSMRMQTWPDGSPLTVFVFGDDSDAHKSFCRSVLGVLPFHLRRNWDRLTFSGSGQAPTMVKGMEEMKMKVATTPGAIGYIREEYIDDSIVVINVSR